MEKAKLKFKVSYGNQKSKLMISIGIKLALQGLTQ